MCIAWLLVLALGCAHKSNEAPAAPAADRPASAPAAAPPLADAAGERADRGSAGDGARPDEETSGCSADADCALTRVEPGGCCPMLCTPRVVTRKRAEALEANASACNKGKQCVQPLCRPPAETLVPACVRNRCVGRSGPSY